MSAWKKSFLRTTDSAHPFPVFANVAATLTANGHQSAVGCRHHLHSPAPRVYLSSRRVGRLLAAGGGLGVGPQPGSRVSTGGVAHGLGGASTNSGVSTSLRSRRAVCRSAYVTLWLAEHSIRGSMSRTGNPYDNAYAESFMKTLKYEEVYRNDYSDLADATDSISEFIEEDLQPAGVCTPPWVTDHRLSSSMGEHDTSAVGTQGGPVEKGWIYRFVAKMAREKNSGAAHAAPCHFGS